MQSDVMMHTGGYFEKEGTLWMNMRSMRLVDFDRKSNLKFGVKIPNSAPF